jgi:hypothetical protein
LWLLVAQQSSSWKIQLWQKSTQPLLQSGYGFDKQQAIRSKMHEPFGSHVPQQLPGFQPPQFGQSPAAGGNGPQPPRQPQSNGGGPVVIP